MSVLNGDSEKFKSFRYVLPVSIYLWVFKFWYIVEVTATDLFPDFIGDAELFDFTCLTL